MSRTIFMLIFALVLLGFLASTALHMYSQIEALKAENQRLSEALSKMGSQYNLALQERDSLKSENTELVKENESLQQAYASENQARVRAETERATLQTKLDELMTSAQREPQTRVLELESSTHPVQGASLAIIIPLGAVLFLMVAGLRVSQYSVKKAPSKPVPTIRRFPSSIPRS